MKATECSDGRLAVSVGTGMFARIAILGGLFLYAYYPVISGLVADWLAHREYSHAFLVPVLSMYLLWKRRRNLSALGTPSLVGLGVLGIGLAALWLGSLSGEDIIQRLSLPLTLFGLVYFTTAWRTARVCLFPFCYLLLMIPVPFPLYKTMAIQLRLFDAALVSSWASTLGVPVLLDGYLLHLPRITLEVADSCSGTLSILALVALGTFYISELDLPFVRKAVLWIVMIPISVLANVIRILIVVLFVHYSGNWVLETTFHQLTGMVNFVFGFTMVMIVGYFMRRSPRAERIE